MYLQKDRYLIHKTDFEDNKKYVDRALTYKSNLIFQSCKS